MYKATGLQCGSYERPAGGAICSIACQINDNNKTNKNKKGRQNSTRCVRSGDTVDN